MDYDKYIKQIEQFYNKSLSTHSLIELGTTPEVLTRYGAPELPLVMRQGTLTKCVRKTTGSRSAHELPRSVIEELPKQIENPIFLIQDRKRNSIVLISDATDKNYNKLLTAILLDTVQHANRVNEIKSIYGKTNLKEYLQKQIELQQLNIIDNKKAEMLSRVVGLQLPMALITNSSDNKVAFQDIDVNKNFQIFGKLQMIELMKSQLADFNALQTEQADFNYFRFDEKSERLVYVDKYENHHDLFHSVVAGKEVCLYHVNNERNIAVPIPVQRESIMYKLDQHRQEIGAAENEGNNLADQERKHQER